MTDTRHPNPKNLSRADLLAALHEHDRGDGRLARIVDDTLAANPSATLDEVRTIVLEDGQGQGQGQPAGLTPGDPRNPNDPNNTRDPNDLRDLSKPVGPRNPTNPPRRNP